MSSPGRTKVHLADVVHDGGRQDVLLTAGCPHCKGTILFDANSVSQSISLASVLPESRPGRLPRHAARLVDIMRPRVPCVCEDTPMSAVIDLLAAHKASFAAVVDSDDRPMGVITPEEIFRQLSLEASGKGGNTARDAMSRWVVCLDGDNLAENAVSVLAHGNAQCIVVVSESGQVLGLVTSHELVRWMGARTDIVPRAAQ